MNPLLLQMINPWTMIFLGPMIHANFLMDFMARPDYYLEDFNAIRQSSLK